MLLKTIKLFAYAARPKTLVIGASPILIGTTLSVKAGYFSLPIFLWTFLGALLIQIGTNYSNDYFDYLKGADTEERKGSKKLLEQKLVTPKAMKFAFIFCFALALVISLLLSLYGGLLLFGIGCICVLFSLLYTAGPYPLAYLGLGDLFVLVFYGPVATLFTYYLQTLSFSPLALLVSLAPGLFGVAILNVNNIRDYEEDKKVDKKTLVVRYGRLFGKIQYALSLSIAFCIPILYMQEIKGSYYLLLGSLLFVFSLPLMKTVFFFKDPASLNPVLAKTAKLLLLYTLVFCLGNFL